MTEKKEAGREDPGELKDDTNDAGGTVDSEGSPKSGAKEATGASSGKSSHNAHKDKEPLFDTPGFQKVVAVMLGLITAALSIAMIVLVFKAVNGGDGGRWDTAFFTVFIGLFGVLITGLFVFMAFRIDRGARWEAQQVAEKVAKRAARIAAKEARSAARKRADKVAAERADKVATERADKVAAEKAEEVAAERADKVAAEKAEEVTKRAEKAAIERAEIVAANKVQEVATNISSDMIENWSKIWSTFGRRKDDE